MKKIAIWSVVISFVVIVICYGVMGLAIFDNEPDMVSLTAKISLPFLIIMFSGLVYLRWGSWKCPHCGAIQLVGDRFCPYCGKERKK